EQELRQRPRLLDEVRASEATARLRKRREREPVPGGDRLVVEARLRPSRTDRQQPRPRLLVQLAPKHEAPVLERLQPLLRRAVAAAISTSPRRRRSSSAEAGGNFGARPKPPHPGSNSSPSRRTPWSRSDSVSGSDDGAEAAARSSA